MKRCSLAKHALKDFNLFASLHQSMTRDGNGISEQAYMYEAILAKHELNEAMIADGAGPHARHSGL